MATITCKVCGRGFEAAAYAVGRRKICSDICRASEHRRISKACMASYRATEAGKAAYTEYNKRYKRTKNKQ